MKTLILVLTLVLASALPASATFSIVGYGPRALELLRQGLTAQQAMDRLFAEDTFPGKDARQLAIVDAKGNIAVFTGDAANAWRGHVKGKTWSAQGNILVGQHVVEAMGRAFDRTNDELAEKLYAALKAGDEAGGDSRGRQSASILVVREAGGRNTNNDRYVFVNVDDHQDPMSELRRPIIAQASGRRDINDLSSLTGGTGDALPTPGANAGQMPDFSALGLFGSSPAAREGNVAVYTIDP